MSDEEMAVNGESENGVQDAPDPAGPVFKTALRSVFLFAVVIGLLVAMQYRDSILGYSDIRWSAKPSGKLAIEGFPEEDKTLLADAGKDVKPDEKAGTPAIVAPGQAGDDGKPQDLKQVKPVEPVKPVEAKPQPVVVKPDEPEKPKEPVKPRDADAAKPVVADGGQKKSGGDEVRAAGSASGASSVVKTADKVDWKNHEITGPVPRANVVVYLRQKALMLRSHADIVRVYRNIAVAKDTSGPKEKRGDGKSPVGTYYVCEKIANDYGRSLRISYPSAADAKKGMAAGLVDADTAASINKALVSGEIPPQDTALGGSIMITSLREEQAETDGGVGLYPGQLEELWLAVSPGTPIIFLK